MNFPPFFIEDIIRIQNISDSEILFLIKTSFLSQVMCVPFFPISVQFQETVLWGKSKNDI